MAKTTVVNRIDTIYIDTENPTVSVNTTVNDAGLKHSITITIRGIPITGISGLAWNKGTANRIIPIPTDSRTGILKAMYEDKSVTAKLTVTTYKGSTYVGISERNCQIATTSHNSRPVIEGFIYLDSNIKTTAVTGNTKLFIQNYSILKVTPLTAKPRNESKITDYTVSCNGVSKSSTTAKELNLGTITKSGDVVVMVTVTDSRGYTTSIKKTITVIPYSSPNLSTITLRRTNEIESEIQLIFNGSYSPITIDGVNHNQLLSFRYQYKRTSDANYGNFVDILSDLKMNGTSYSYSNLQLMNLDVNMSYDFHIEIRDAMEKSVITDLYYLIPQGTPLVALRKQKVGINNPNPQSALDVTGEIHMNGYPVMGIIQTSVEDDVSLNSLTTQGIYFRRRVPQENMNYPALVFGMLEVFSCSTNLVIQRYTARDTPFDVYIRSKVNSSWSKWVKK